MGSRRDDSGDGVCSLSKNLIQNLLAVNEYLSNIYISKKSVENGEESGKLQ